MWGDFVDVLERLKELQDQHGWTNYRIAQEAGLSPNTVANVYKRNFNPSIATLDALCKAFGITLAQFFAEGDFVEVTPEVSALVSKWSTLSAEQKAVVWQVMNSYEVK